ncbi:class B sortase [Enterocloster aldenensis]|uniref:class B sortase n=1 Tax=Enterocloster aldenensis TaxID=358742 RepID=UPI0035172FB8
MIAGVFFCCFLFICIKRMPGDKSQPVDYLSGISSIPAGKIDAVISPENESWIKQLQEINTEIAGWLRIEGTNIDGPILQAEDNTKYLTAGYDGKANPAGAFFLDYECESDFSGQHNIIYGHNMKNGSMFHDLLNFKKESYFREHQEIIIYTPEKEICLQPIAVVCTEADGRRRITDFADRTEFQSYVAAMLEEGKYGRRTLRGSGPLSPAVMNLRMPEPFCMPGSAVHKNLAKVLFFSNAVDAGKFCLL